MDTNLFAGIVPFSGSQGTVASLQGYQIPNSISGLTDHAWTADSNGLFHTVTDLHAEWSDAYARMLAGQGASLTAIQRLEGNAEAVFESTGLAKLTAAQQAADREDVQRELDAIGAAMKVAAKTLGLNPAAALTVQTYQQIGHIIQSSPVLEELAQAMA